MTFSLIGTENIMLSRGFMHKCGFHQKRYEYAYEFDSHTGLEQYEGE